MRFGLRKPWPAPSNVVEESRKITRAEIAARQRCPSGPGFVSEPAGAREVAQRVLGEAAHNAWIADSIPRIFNLHLRLWFFISRRLGHWEDIARSHEVMTRDVVAALQWRDAAKARQAMETYIGARLVDIKAIL